MGKPRISKVAVVADRRIVLTNRGIVLHHVRSTRATWSLSTARVMDGDGEGRLFQRRAVQAARGRSARRDSRPSPRRAPRRWWSRAATSVRQGFALLFADRSAASLLRLTLRDRAREDLQDRLMRRIAAVASRRRWLRHNASQYSVRDSIRDSGCGPWHTFPLLQLDETGELAL